MMLSIDLTSSCLAAGAPANGSGAGGACVARCCGVADLSEEDCALADCATARVAAIMKIASFTVSSPWCFRCERCGSAVLDARTIYQESRAEKTNRRAVSA